MKVLWVTPVAPLAVCSRLGLTPNYGGSWIHALLDVVGAERDLELAVVWAQRGRPDTLKFAAGGVTYFVTPEPGRFAARSQAMLRLNDEMALALGFDNDRRALRATAAAIDEFTPDVVQVFGTESRHALVAPLVRPPVVVWLQGVLNIYRHHFFGTMRAAERFRQPRMMWNYYRMLAAAAREREIFRRCRWFMGRTAWDAAQQASRQPRGRYFAVQECMRREFYDAKPWRLEETSTGTVFTTTSASLLKGTDVLLQAIATLAARHRHVRLRVAGVFQATNPVSRRLVRIANHLGLLDRIEFLGQLGPAGLVRELRRARLFVLPSFIENSPNSLAEAQMVGVPCVATSVGGVPEMVIDEQTGLLCPPGNSDAMARQMERILADDRLAVRLASASRTVAHERHSRPRIVEALLGSYRDICASGGQ